jgi:hypothetical protein
MESSVMASFNVPTGNSPEGFQRGDRDDPKTARRTRSIKAEPVARLECFAETPLGFFPRLETLQIPPPAQKTFDADIALVAH